LLRLLNGVHTCNLCHHLISDIVKWVGVHKSKSVNSLPNSKGEPPAT
jgi:hypothetical protein